MSRRVVVGCQHFGRPWCMKMEARRSSEIVRPYHNTTRHHNPEDQDLNRSRVLTKYFDMRRSFIITCMLHKTLLELVSALRNVGILPQHYTSQPRRPQCGSSSPRKPDASQHKGKAVPVLNQVPRHEDISLLN